MHASGRRQNRWLPFIAAYAALSVFAQVAPRVALASTGLRLRGLHTEGRGHALGLDVAAPRFTWQLSSGTRDTLQTSYRVVVTAAGSAGQSHRAVLWDSHQVASAEPAAIYHGAALQSRRHYVWSLQVWASPGKHVTALATSWFETAFMTPGEWTAQWIAGLPRSEVKPTAVQGIADDACCHDVHTGLAIPAVTGAVEIQVRDPEAIATGRIQNIAGTDYTVAAVSTVADNGSYTVRLTSQLTASLAAGASVTSPAPAEFCRPVGVGKDGRKDTQGECLEVRPTPRFRYSFAVASVREHGRLLAARLYTVGLGYGEFWLNGAAASPDRLAPNFTDYTKTVLYSTSDVTESVEQALLGPRENVLAAELGSGQFDQDADGANWAYVTAAWRDRPRLLASLILTYKDGYEQRIDSGPAWMVSEDGPIRYAGLYRGETYDARLDQPAWNLAGYDFAAWRQALPVDAPRGTLRAAMGVPTRIVSQSAPGRRINTSPGVVLYDTGQERAGWATVAVSGVSSGTPIEIHYSDQLNAQGAVDSSGCCIAGQIQTDYYVSNGKGTVSHPEFYAPHFSYKGFQYIALSSPGGTPLPASAHVCVISVQEVRSDIAPAGAFHTDNDRINRLEAMVRGSIAENYVAGIVTDTPEYEKNAWTGDASLTAPTASLLFDTELQYRKSLFDMQDAQLATGEVTLLAPGAQGYGHVGGFGKNSSCCGATPIWDSFWFVVPWEAYSRYGDKRFLATAYPMMQKYLQDWVPRWVDKDGDTSPYTLRSGLGDWDPPRGKEGRGPTSVTVPPSIYSSTTAYYAYLVHIAAETARALGEIPKANEFDATFAHIRDAYNAKWWDPQLGYYHEAGDNTLYQTQQVLPLAFDLVPSPQRASLQRKLIADILDTRAGHEEVGIAGARWLLPVLSQAALEHIERSDVAMYTILTQRTYPSFGYWMDAGWTTLGETWERTSRTRTHHMYGSVGQWLYENLTGIQAAEPGYGVIRFAPTPLSALRSASATYQSVRGPVTSSWRHTPCGMHYTFTVPANATAFTELPTTPEETVVSHSGAEHLSRSSSLDSYRFGSGTYRFDVVARRATKGSCIP